MKNKNFKLKIDNQGFTLTEIIVVTALALIIFVMVFNFSQNFFSWNAASRQNLEAQSGARRVLKTMVKELRSTSPSSLGAYPLGVVATSSLTFFVNLDSDAPKEQVRYFLQGTDLKKGVIKPSGNPLTYNPANEQLSTLVRDVRNGTSTPIFEYFDSSYTGTSTPLVQPVQATKVRLVRINLKINKDPNKQPTPIIVESQVFLRNLKDNL